MLWKKILVLFGNDRLSFLLDKEVVDCEILFLYLINCLYRLLKLFLFWLFKIFKVELYRDIFKLI